MRLHIHPHKGPRDTAYIVGDKSAIRALSDALKEAANGVVGIETVKLFTSDGHEYKIVITSDVSEEEWQTTPPSYSKDASPDTHSSIKIYNDYVNNAPEAV